jgi:hypothetical protein
MKQVNDKTTYSSLRNRDELKELLLQDMVSYSDAKIHTERDGGFPSFWLH